MKLEEYYIPEAKIDIVDEMDFKCDWLYESGGCNDNCNECIYSSLKKETQEDYKKWITQSTT